jgi:hypothetical protein
LFLWVNIKVAGFLLLLLFCFLNHTVPAEMNLSADNEPELSVNQERAVGGALMGNTEEQLKE